MVFPLLKLPSLAYEEVLLNFEVADLVDFSLCSSRCHRIIRSTRFPLTGIEVSVNSNYYTLTFCIDTKPKPVAYWDFLKNPWRKVSDTENGWRRIGKTRIRIQKEPEWRSTLNPVKKLKDAFDYVRDLFRLPVTRYWMWDNDQILFPQYFGITQCEKLYIWTHYEIPINELKYILEKMEISKRLMLYLKQNDYFKCEFVQFSMNELIIMRAFWITKETFLAMDCARITLHGNKDLPIRDFVSQWLSSRNTRFEWLKMTGNMRWNNEEQINWNDGFEPMKWNSAIRGRNFRISSYQRVDCEKGIDFLREDGMLATVAQSRSSTIYFIVWHKRFQPEADRLQLDHR